MIESILHPDPPANVTGALLTAYVLLDVFLIVVLARLLGTAMTKIRQPRVVGEILAGILLGPTLIGADLSLFIAPAEARPIISAIATVALIMFMFLAGVEYDASVVAGMGKQAALLAITAVGIPAALGFPVAIAMHSSTYAGPQGQDFLSFALFIGAALSVTAFPVMAHILMERGELNTKMGALGVATTGMMSILMFLYIAFAASVAAARGFGSLLLKLGLVAVFGLVSWFVVRPALARFLPSADGGVIPGQTMAVVFAGMLLYGLVGDRLGIHALVGGFVWGLILPTDRGFRAAVSSKIKDVAMVMFLPVFFALAGFSTDLKLLSPDTLGIVGLVLAAAIGGKLLAAVPARAFGIEWREVGILGALLNTRGLLVLVAGLIGLSLEIITTVTFTIIVMVALVTNLMTLPLLDLFTPRSDELADLVEEST
ncbi:MAG: cation:proton antiporter [Acidimicrobiia bacterium]